MTAIKKKRREKGSREDLLGSNPHSKGEHFSRSAMDFLDNKEANIIIIVVIVMRIIITQNIIITYSEGQTY
jgi:hypothetical protein